MDHRDRNKINNNWENLREATHQENAFNTGLDGHNTSGYQGVSLHGRPGRRKRWRAYIVVNLKQIGLGYYYTPEKASAAYELAAEALYGEFRREVVYDELPDWLLFRSWWVEDGLQSFFIEREATLLFLGVFVTVINSMETRSTMGDHLLSNSVFNGECA